MDQSQAANSSELHIWDKPNLFPGRKMLQGPSVQRQLPFCYRPEKFGQALCYFSALSSMVYGGGQAVPPGCLHQLLPAHLQARETGLSLSTCM